VNKPPQYFVWPYGKNGPAQMATRYINVGRKSRRKEKGTTEDPMGRHVEDGSRGTKVTNSQIPVRMRYTHATSLTATSLQIADLVIKKLSCRWFHLEAIALMELILRIYLFTFKLKQL
jgi:hypothetical protein